MIDKRNTTCIDKDKYVIYCIKCGLQIIDTLSRENKCPNCGNSPLVIKQDLLVLK